MEHASSLVPGSSDLLQATLLGLPAAAELRWILKTGPLWEGPAPGPPALDSAEKPREMNGNFLPTGGWGSLQKVPDML